MADSKSSAAALTLDDQCFVVMGSDVIDIFDLECNVCKELFDMKNKLPKLLPCKHTLCKTCLETLKKNNSDFDCPLSSSPFTPDCPLCSKKIGEIKFLPNDYRVVKSLEIVQKAKVSFKNACLKHNCKILNRFCESCEVPVCSECCRFLHNEEEDHDIVELTTGMKNMCGQLDDFERKCITSIQQGKVRRDILKHIKDGLVANETTEIAKVKAEFDRYNKLLSERKEALITMIKDKTKKRVSETNLEMQQLEGSTTTLQNLFNEFTISRETEAVRELFKVRKQILQDTRDLLKVSSNEGLGKSFEFRPVNGDRLQTDIAAIGDLHEKIDLKLECPPSSGV